MTDDEAKQALTDYMTAVHAGPDVTAAKAAVQEEQQLRDLYEWHRARAQHNAKAIATWMTTEGHTAGWLPLDFYFTYEQAP